MAYEKFIKYNKIITHLEYMRVIKGISPKLLHLIKYIVYIVTEEIPNLIIGGVELLDKSIIIDTLKELKHILIVSK